MTDKAALRRSLLNARKTMAPEEWRFKSDRLCDQLKKAEIFRQAKTILAYHSACNEPCLRSLFEAQPIDAHTPIWGFPRCVGKDMHWHQWSPHHGLPLQKGAFNILEPHPQSPKIESKHVDLILVPAVACDRHGYRLGYGGGFYDRMFSHSQWQGIPTICIVFSEMVLESLPVDPWDYPLDAVCTDNRWITID
jgi:5-formyltetrahydrofolate cyclo-ligase